MECILAEHPTWTTVDVSRPEEMDALRQREYEEAVQRVRAAAAELQAQGIIDSQGRRIRNKLRGSESTRQPA
jgi:hypothetical protein